MDAIGKLSSSNVYNLMNKAKGAPLQTGALYLAKSTVDNREKFVTANVVNVKIEDSQDAELAREILKAQNWQNSVKQHERAHMQAGGEFAGAATYVYGKGPDGRTYITGGEVSMKVPSGGDLDQLNYALERVKRAAMAPADPSPQDLATFSAAAARQGAVRAEIMKKKAIDQYERQKEDKLNRSPIESVEVFRTFKYREISSFEMAI